MEGPNFQERTKLNKSTCQLFQISNFSKLTAVTGRMADVSLDDDRVALTLTLLINFPLFSHHLKTSSLFALLSSLGRLARRDLELEYKCMCVLLKARAIQTTKTWEIQLHGIISRQLGRERSSNSNGS